MNSPVLESVGTQSVIFLPDCEAHQLRIQFYRTKEGTEGFGTYRHGEWSAEGSTGDRECGSENPGAQKRAGEGHAVEYGAGGLYAVGGGAWGPGGVLRGR